MLALLRFIDPALITPVLFPRNDRFFYLVSALQQFVSSFCLLRATDSVTPFIFIA